MANEACVLQLNPCLNSYTLRPCSIMRPSSVESQYSVQRSMQVVRSRLQSQELLDKGNSCSWREVYRIMNHPQAECSDETRFMPVRSQPMALRVSLLFEFPIDLATGLMYTSFRIATRASWMSDWRWLMCEGIHYHHCPAIIHQVQHVCVSRIREEALACHCQAYMG